MPELPTFEAEFERKLVDTIGQARAKFESGLIANHAYQHTMEAINNVSRGLCDEAISLALDQERDMAGYGDDTDTTVWKHGSTVVVVTKQRMGDKVRVLTNKASGLTDKTVEFNFAVVPSEAATYFANKLKVGLIKKGYMRVV